jgi:hypothetical protein
LYGGQSKLSAEYVVVSQISPLPSIAASHLKKRRVNCKQFERFPLTLKDMKSQSGKKNQHGGSKLPKINAITVSILS